ncbi:hypothetical protein [Usitatibacter palustris]|uniref:SH3 domain-containing protein n=1 Tax=Usitatibacter palustris TaxID=2732487 RepID=A0A6M4H5R3_9PROT|nr:hypothetical protein [Usitatibacter palustris]QJR14830.1 hypothetical protein DSM104440_01643 [Usitatibacter palustris]
MDTKTFTRFLLLATLLAGTAPPSIAGVRTAQTSVSATVVASCRVSVAPFASSRGAVTHRGHCSQETRPVTRAVIEYERAMPPGVVVRAQPADAKWIRYDVEY